MNIAVSGAGGSIGKEICYYLMQILPGAKVRVGSRKQSDYIKHILKVYDCITWQKVDVTDPTSLQEFINGQDVLINAAGCSSKIGLRIAEQVISTCNYVEVGYNQQFEKALAHQVRKSCIFGAGSAPGFLGLLTRDMVERCAPVKRRRLWYLVREPLSLSAAMDLAELFGTEQYKDTKTVTKKQDSIRIPLFAEPVYPFQYYDAEAKSVDAIYGIEHSELYMLREDADLYEIAQRYQGKSKELANYFMKASEVALIANSPMIRIIQEVSGNSSATAVIQARSQSALSGCVAAATAVALISLQIKPEICRMAEITCWKKCLDLMKKTDIFDYYMEYEHSIEVFEQDESGEI